MLLDLVNRHCKSEFCSYFIISDLGWWAGSASWVDIPMFAGVKNPWKLIVSMAHGWNITPSDWRLFTILLCSIRARDINCCFWLSGMLHMTNFLAFWEIWTSKELDILLFMQDLGVLVMLFSMFHACVGLIVPLLARLRTM